MKAPLTLARLRALKGHLRFAGANVRHAAVAPIFDAAYTACMQTTTREGWEYYERRCRKEHVKWLRSLTPNAAFALYKDLYRFARSVEGVSDGMDRVERSRWQEKLTMRATLLAALKRLDELQSGRRDSTHAG